MRLHHPARNLALSLGLVSQTLHAEPVQVTKAASPLKIPRDHITQTTLNISKLFQAYRLTHDIDRESVESHTLPQEHPITGLEAFEDKIRTFVAKEQRIEFYLVGFPFKSGNHEKKTLSPLPDMAERSAFIYLNTLIKDVAKIYDPGMRITIICDGATFSDILGIPDQHLVDYERSLCQLISDMPGIRLITSQHLKRNFHTLSMLRRVIDDTSPSNQEIETQFSTDPHMQSELTTTVKRIALELDHTKGNKLIQRDGLENITKSVIKRSLRFGSYIKTYFPELTHGIKLSVHFQKDLSQKFGIKLSENSNITPWHGVLVRDNTGQTSIKHKMDIDSSQFIPVTDTIHGMWCTYFKPKA